MTTLMTPTTVHEILDCPLDLLRPHPHNPRGEVDPAAVGELADSVKQMGVLEPLIVTAEADAFLIVAGHRRFAAARAAGLVSVPAVVKDLSPVEQEEVMLAENIQRENLSPLQEARAYRRLMDQGVTVSDIARRLGTNQARVHSRHIILKLAPAVQQMFDRNELPTTLAPLLHKVKFHERQERLAGLVATRRLTVPRLKAMVDEMARAEQEKPARPKGAATKPAAPPAPPPKVVRPAYSRADALADLKRQADRVWSLDNLVDALEGVCAGCGMAGFPAICGACPLPQYVRNLTEAKR